MSKKPAYKPIWIVALMFCMLGLSPIARSDDAGRKAKNKPAPQYPELAKRMNVSGSVKLQLLVAANGTVKSVKPLGGHPLLIDAAQSAVKQWRYEPGQESTELVEFKFTPSQ